MLKPVFFTPSEISVTISPVYLIANASTSSGNSVTITATPVDYIGAVTYSWVFTDSGVGVGTATLTSPTAASTEVHYTGLTYLGADVSGTLTCTVTDASGGTASATINISITRTSGTSTLPP